MVYLISLSLSCLLRSHFANANEGIGKITFPATKNMNLNPLPLDPYNTPDVNDIEVLVSTTTIFLNHYTPSEITYSEDPPTELIPEIEMIRGSAINKFTETRASPFGFVGTVAEAYSKHHNLSIRPDDIWQAIISQFAFYVLAREDELRDTFVDFEGKKELKLLFGGSMKTFTAWDSVPLLFLDLLDENIKSPGIREWYLPNFTTTTDADKVGAAAAAMCTFQNYFTYAVGFVCGIPQISLLGSVEDWEQLRQRIERLDTFDDGTGILTEKWVPMLRHILDEFVVSAKSGSGNNLDFWDQIMHSATLPYMGEKLSGWILAFTFFDSEGKQIIWSEEATAGFLGGNSESATFALPWGMIDANDVNANILECPIQIDDSDGNSYNSTLFVGQMAFDYSPDVDASRNNLNINPSSLDDILLISPRTDWSLVVDKNTGLVEIDRPTSTKRLQFPDMCREGRRDPGCGSEYERCFESDSLLDPDTIPDPVREPVVIACFSENSVVVEKNMGPMKIKDIQIGNIIQSSYGGFSRIYSFGHRNVNAITNFLQIHYTIGGGKLFGSIEITPNHLMSINSFMLPASSVQVGDRLQGNTEEEMIVSKILNIRSRGVYAPFTESGTVLINNVLASSYVTLQPGTGSLKFASIDTGLSMHDLSHLFQGIHRMSCQLYWPWCANESYTKEGISTWVSGGRVVFSVFLTNIEWMFTLALIFMIPIFTITFFAWSTTKKSIYFCV